jgi:hypothetical protein
MLIGAADFSQKGVELFSTKDQSLAMIMMNGGSAWY